MTRFIVKIAILRIKISLIIIGFAYREVPINARKLESVIVVMKNLQMQKELHFVCEMYAKGEMEYE